MFTHGLSPPHLKAAACLRRVGELTGQITRIRASAGLDRDDAQGNADTANSSPAVDSVEHRLQSLTDERSGLLKEAERYLAGDLTLGPDISAGDASAAVEALIGTTGTGARLLTLLDLQTEWLQRVASDENLASSFLRASSVVAGTCVGFLSHPAVRDLEFDLCILDEASKATATEALVPMARAKRWILIGDTNQLPPMDEEVLRHADLLEEQDLDPEVVKETLFSRLANVLPEYAHFTLREQYRMIRPIGDMISSCFYRDELNSPRTIGLQGYDFLGKPITWIDTGPMGRMRREDAQSGGTSYANRAEARLAMERLEVINGAVEKGLIAPAGRAPLHVLLISPYRSQVEELTRRLQTTHVGSLAVEVQSVDAVQGRESDLALFSVTRSNAQGRLGFLGEDYWRRINVALSRARFGLTIIGDAEFCRSNPGAFRQVLKYIKDNPQDCEIRMARDA